MSKRKRNGHHLTLVDRGAPHQHRWLAKCSCGASAPPLNLRSSAKQWHASHARGAQRGGLAKPRRVTPPHKLPPELR